MFANENVIALARILRKATEFASTVGDQAMSRCVPNISSGKCRLDEIPCAAMSCLARLRRPGADPRTDHLEIKRTLSI